MFNYSPYDRFPIFNGNGNYADAFPQALMITTIVIGASVTALALMLSIKVFHQFGSLDWDEVFREDYK